MSQFEVYFTTPHQVNGAFGVVAAARILARAWQFEGASLQAPWGPKPRQFDFTVNNYDTVHDRVKDSKSDGITAYSTFIYVEWRGWPVFWGPLIDPEWGLKSHKVQLRAYSQLKRCEFHQVVLGDAAIAKTNGFNGLIPIDYRGLRLLRDAAENRAGQAYLPLGIKNGTNTGPTHTQLMQFKRGAQVLRSMEELTGNTFGPEMIERPLKVKADPPYYAQLDTADAAGMGTDRYDEVVFQGGFGLNNLDDARHKPGGKIITHAHVLSEDARYRETRVNTVSATENGVWVEWAPQSFNVTHATEDEILGAVGESYIQNYSIPVNYAELDLKRDNEIGAVDQKYWLDDFDQGDFIRACIKSGHMYLPDAPYRITDIGLTQEDMDVGVRQSISVVPLMDTSYDTDDEE